MRKLINKIFILCVLTTFVVFSQGCSDLLDQMPQGEWIDGDGSDGSFQSDIFTLYAQIRGYHVTSGIPPLAIHNMRSEDVEKGSTSSDGSEQAKMYDDFEYTATNGLIADYWTNNYKMIHTANKVIDGMKDVKLSEGDLINKSEAHFFRAFSFFNLVRAFGEVPLIDFSIDDATEGNIAKSSVENIYKRIDADLLEAAKYLPKKWDSRYIGRLTWGAARSLHARTFMMRNMWDSLYVSSTEVINSGIYNLNTSFSKIFREEGENSSESVFELQCTATDALPGSSDIGSQYAEVQGVRGAGEWDLGWGWHTPTQNLADAFEKGDPRKDETLLYFAKSYEEANEMKPNQPWGEIPIANKDVSNKYYNKKVYSDPKLRLQFNKKGFWINIRMIRYSDVVLMAAEAANELGKSGEALSYLEQVRARARGTNSDVLPKITTTDQVELRDAIRHERRVELAMEWDRFYDLVRWGIAKDVLHAAGKTNYQEKHKYLPLPQTEVDKSNGMLKQNPEYL